jgi:hypothetical protein
LPVAIPSNNNKALLAHLLFLTSLSSFINSITTHQDFCLPWIPSSKHTLHISKYFDIRIIASMFFRTLALAAAVGSAVAQRPTNTSICDYYTGALLTNNTAANQMTLLTLVVNTAVIGNCMSASMLSP